MEESRGKVLLTFIIKLIDDESSRLAVCSISCLRPYTCLNSFNQVQVFKAPRKIQKMFKEELIVDWEMEPAPCL